MEQPKDPQKELEFSLHELEERVDRLRALYEQYFMGYEKLEPSVQRKDVDRRFVALRKLQIRNTAIRFRFNVITQKFNTYAMYWTRICRQIEEGTYKRHLAKAERRFGDRPLGEARDVEVSIDVDLADFDDVDIDAVLAEADAAAEALVRERELGALGPTDEADTDPPREEHFSEPPAELAAAVLRTRPAIPKIAKAPGAAAPPSTQATQAAARPAAPPHWAADARPVVPATASLLSSRLAAGAPAAPRPPEHPAPSPLARPTPNAPFTPAGRFESEPEFDARTPRPVALPPGARAVTLRRARHDAEGLPPPSSRDPASSRAIPTATRGVPAPAPAGARPAIRPAPGGPPGLRANEGRPGPGFLPTPAVAMTPGAVPRGPGPIVHQPPEGGARPAPPSRGAQPTPISPISPRAPGGRPPDSRPRPALPSQPGTPPKKP